MRTLQIAAVAAAVAAAAAAAMVKKIEIAGSSQSLAETEYEQNEFWYMYP